MTVALEPAELCGQVDAQLRERYVQLLDVDHLAGIARDEKQGRLSGLFLPAATEQYLRSDVRVMLVGKEPRGWGRPLQANTDANRPPEALSAYIDAQMEKHRLVAQSPASTSKFRQFHARLHAYFGTGPAASHGTVMWGNLLCMSLSGKSPRKAKTFGRIKDLSRDLLAAQFDVLRPDLVVFASGYGYDSLIKNLLPDYRTLPGIVPRQFWPLERGVITAFRIAHPQSHTRVEARFALQAVRDHIDGKRADALQNRFR